MTKITKKSYAKINLGLQVLNKRLDGFHNINTIFKKINLFDEITFTPNNTDEINLKVLNNDLLNQENILNNLIIKAFRKIQKKSPKKIGVDVELNKNIPIGAGLGGGSSNAASTLIALMEMFRINLTQGEMSVISQSLGSDVPFFMGEGMAIAKSRGEKLKYFDMDNEFEQKYKIVLINPQIHISTPFAYSSLNRETFTELNKKQNLYPEINFYNILLKSNDNPSLLRNYIINDFEKVVFEKYPEISEIKKTLYDFGAVLSLMSGSGSTVFALFENNEKNQTTFNNINSYFTNNYPNYYIYFDK